VRQFPQTIPQTPRKHFVAPGRVIKTTANISEHTAVRRHFPRVMEQV
jgi:hypothetical protein